MSNNISQLNIITINDIIDELSKIGIYVNSSNSINHIKIEYRHIFQFLKCHIKELNGIHIRFDIIDSDKFNDIIENFYQILMIKSSNMELLNCKINGKIIDSSEISYSNPLLLSQNDQLNKNNKTTIEIIPHIPKKLLKEELNKITIDVLSDIIIQYQNSYITITCDFSYYPTIYNKYNELKHVNLTDVIKNIKHIMNNNNPYRQKRNVNSIFKNIKSTIKNIILDEYKPTNLSQNNHGYHLENVLSKMLF